MDHLINEAWDNFVKEMIFPPLLEAVIKEDLNVSMEENPQTILEQTQENKQQNPNLIISPNRNFQTITLFP